MQIEGLKYILNLIPSINNSSVDVDNNCIEVVEVNIVFFF